MRTKDVHELAGANIVGADADRRTGVVMGARETVVVPAWTWETAAEGIFADLRKGGKNGGGKRIFVAQAWTAGFSLFKTVCRYGAGP